MDLNNPSRSKPRHPTSPPGTVTESSLDEDLKAKVNSQTSLSDATPAAPGTAAAGTSTDASRGDHVHPPPALSDATPAAPGTAAAGTSTDASRGDHVHPPTTAAQVGLGAVTATGATAAAARSVVDVYSIAATDAAIVATVGGLLYKGSCRAVAVTNVASLSGTTIIDNVSLIADDRVLLTGQSTPTENGPWLIAAGAWTRPDPVEVAACAAFPVSEGTAYHDTLWFVTTNDPIDQGVTGIALSQLALNIPSTQITDSTAAGRTLLSAADAAAQRTSLSVPSTSEALLASLFTTQGDIIVRGVSAPARLALGAAGTRLRSGGTTATWAEPDIVCTVAELATTYAPAAAMRGMIAYTTDAGVTYLCRRSATSTYEWAIIAAGATAAAARTSIGALGEPVGITNGSLLYWISGSISALAPGDPYMIPRIAAGGASIEWVAGSTALGTAPGLIPLCDYAVSPGPATVVGRLRFDPGTWDKTALGYTTVLTLRLLGDVSGAFAATFTLYNVTTTNTDGTLTATETTPTMKSVPVALPSVATIYELRVSHNGTPTTDYATVSGAVIEVTWSV